MKKVIYSLIVIGFLVSCGGGNEKTIDSKGGSENVGKAKDAGVPKKLAYEGSELILNGSGLRSKYFVPVYICGLYLPEKNKNANEIINSEGPVAVRLHIVSRLITRDNMERVVREGFLRSVNGKTAGIQKQIDELMMNFKKTPVAVDDTYDMWYMPGKGLQGYKNGKPWGDIIVCGQEYKSALIGIWLSANPIDAKLKNEMLGL